MTKTATVKSAFTKEFLAKMQTILEADKERLQKELAKYAKPGEGGSAGDAKFPDYGDSEEDNAQEVADYETNLSIESDLQKSLRDVESSLKRMKAGDYGICKYCKKPIEEKRLLARPTSSACVGCKKTIMQEV